ncbi:uncharacterized protein LOC111829026 [Capsella rubella]|uniref:uncharacterized protein LOC111829026 n=1 Tax=Capsella rubella TaxID=81985 RepID=UPI000CD5011F|nr:uncharacterized protein LOC111829026 [Capsella rubella]
MEKDCGQELAKAQLSTCKNPTVHPPPSRKRGRPRKHLDNDDPWSIHNAPRRWEQAQSQSTPTVSQSQSTQNPQHSSAPPAANPSGTGKARGRPPGVKNGEGKGRSKARGKGRGKGSDAPKPPIYFMSPWTDKVFDVWQPKNK